MADNPLTIGSFFKDHLWQILVILFVSAISFIILKEEVKGLATRVDAVEIEQAEYPSQDWFELKFSTIEKRFGDLEKKIDDCVLSN